MSQGPGEKIAFHLPFERRGPQHPLQPSSLRLFVPGMQPGNSSHMLPVQPGPATASQTMQAGIVHAPAASFVGYDATTKEAVWFSDTARDRGLWVLGKTGTGKTTFFLNLMVQDIERGIGVCFVDPVGDAIHDLIARLPTERLKDVVLLDILHPSYTFGLNMYAGSAPTPEGISEAHERVMHLFRLLWGDKTNNDELGVWVRQYLSNSAFTLIENNAKGNSCAMTEIPLLFRNRAAREKLLAGITKQSSLDFWEGYEKLRSDEQEKRADTQLSRVDAFLGNYYAEQIVGQTRTTVDVQQVMNDAAGKILLIKLSNIHKELSQVVGAMIIANLLEAAKARGAMPLADRRPFHIYADEYHLFATADWGEMVEQARKFNVCVNFGHQRMSQLPYAGQQGALGTRNKAVFSISGSDAQEVAKEFDCSPQPGPPNYESLKSPIAEPLEYVVKNRKGVHALPATRSFFQQYGRQLVEKVEQDEQAERDYKMAWERFATSSARNPIMPSIQMPTFDSRFMINFLNALFYQAMMAGKEGRAVGNVHDVICDLFIKVFEPYSDAMTYLTLRDQHRSYYALEEKNRVEDHVVRRWMQTSRYAQLSAYKQGKIGLAQWKKDQIERTLRRLYQQLLFMEVVALRGKVIIVRRGASFYKPMIDEQGVMSSERYYISYNINATSNAQRAYPTELSAMLSVSLAFESWQEAITYYSQVLQTVWVQVEESLMHQASWLYQPQRVFCRDYAESHKEQVELLDAWVLRPGVEFGWYTGKILDEEISRRLERLDYVSKPMDIRILENFVQEDSPLKKEMADLSVLFQEAIQELQQELAKLPKKITEEMQKLENELDILSQLFTVKPGYVTRVAEIKSMLQEVMDELAKAPIEADSGLTKEVPTEIPSAEVERRIANELSSLPDLTARCVFHEKGRPIERTIEIPRLQPGVDEVQLQARLRAIEQYTLDAGCYRLRSEVQAEIQRRRQNLVSSLQQPPPAQQKSNTNVSPQKQPAPTSGPAGVPPPPLVPPKKTRRN